MDASKIEAVEGFLSWRAIGSLWSDSGCCADKRMVQEGLANGYQVR